MFGEGKADSCVSCGLSGASAEGSFEGIADSLVTVGEAAWPVSDMIAGGFGVGGVTGVPGSFEIGGIPMLELSCGGAVLGCPGTGLVSGLVCWVENGDCAGVRSCGEGNGVPRGGEASSFKGEPFVSTVVGGVGVGISLFEKSLCFEVSLGFTPGISFVEIFGGGEIGISGGMVVNEFMGGAGGAGWLMSGCLGTLSSWDDERKGMSSCSLYTYPIVPPIKRSKTIPKVTPNFFLVFAR